MESTRITMDDLVQIRLKKPDDFLVIKETLTRIGIASRTENKLFQTCHIFHKQGQYAIVHFKELFGLDGKPMSLTEQDIARRNTIINLLAEWNLLEIVDAERTKDPVIPVRFIKIIPFSQKPEWELCAKYTLGKRSLKRQLDVS